MLRFIHDRAKELGGAVWASLLAVLVIGLLTAGVLFVQGTLYPMWLAYQREQVEQSKSYVDSTNIALSNFIREYNSLEVRKTENPDSAAVYAAQQTAILNQMCGLYVTLEDVSASNQYFISQHGGCQ